MAIYQVTYLKPKKKGFSKQTAGDFLTINDAVWYETMIKSQGCKDIMIQIR